MSQEEDDQQSDELPEEFMFNSEGVVMDENLLVMAQNAQKKKGKTGRAKNIIFRCVCHCARLFYYTEIAASVVWPPED